jgi:hypothetical protein
MAKRTNRVALGLVIAAVATLAVGVALPVFQVAGYYIRMIGSECPQVGRRFRSAKAHVGIAGVRDDA